MGAAKWFNKISHMYLIETDQEFSNILTFLEASYHRMYPGMSCYRSCLSLREREEDKTAKQLVRMNGFLSLQLELRMELGLRLRLTNKPAESNVL